MLSIPLTRSEDQYEALESLQAKCVDEVAVWHAEIDECEEKIERAHRELAKARLRLRAIDDLLQNTRNEHLAETIRDARSSNDQRFEPGNA